ncbi:MAG TPA: kelch repeat-containing protein [Pseudobacteroides sp.]|uniref:Kelch repeat-containing protein n=1 Tax=Pseudobacteroides sp. TaxID=1968840 RepID=UPI002F95FCBB
MKFKKVLASALSVSILLSTAGMNITSFAAGKQGGNSSYRLHLRSSKFETYKQNKKSQVDYKTDNSSKESSPYIIVFNGPITDEMKDNVIKQGASLLDYIPDFSFVSFLTNDTLEKVKKVECITDVIPYLDEYKIDLDLMEKIKSNDEKVMEEEVDIQVSTFDNGSDEVLSEINKDGTSKVKKRSDLKKVKVKLKSLNELSKLKSVKYIEKTRNFKLHNDVARGIIGGELLKTLGYEGEGQTVCVADSGLDKGNPGLYNNNLHSDFSGRVTKIIDKNSGDGSDSNGHGTHTAGSVLGNGQMSGGKIKGTAPKAKLIVQDIIPDSLGSIRFSETLYDLLKEAYENGARIHTNSWGSSEGGSYTENSINVDKFIWDNKDMTVLFSAGNDGRSGASSVGSPGTAKNCITVGASENFRPYMPIEEGLSKSDDPDERAIFSSYGCKDGRIKPDVVAPGSYIASTRSSVVQYSSNYSENTNYEFKSGTSMATPLTAGSVAVIREYIQKTLGINNPSAALIKAFIINGALTYGYTNEKGWGKVNIYDSLLATKVIDQNSTIKTGQKLTYESSLNVTSTDKPLKVSLVWTDYPGSVSASKALVNDIDLKVISPDGKVIYRGNDFTSPFNSEADRLNNVETVTIDNPVKGQYRIEVEGYNIPCGLQPFSLVASYDFFGIPCNLKAASTVDLINVSWSAVPGATGYDISVDGTVISITDTSYIHKNLDYSTNHKYRVRAKNDEKIGEWSNTIMASTLLNTTTISGKSTTANINLTWKPVEGAEFYDVYFEGQLFEQTQGTTTKLTAIEPNSPYNFAVRARTNFNTSESIDFTINTLDSGLETKASMKEPRAEFSAVAASNGKVYVFGGKNGDSTYLSTVEEYDPENDMWASKDIMKEARAGAAVVEGSNGKIYVIGGYNGSYLDTVEEFDILTGKWTERAQMITPRSGLGAAFIDGKVYAIGGTNESPLDTVEVYDPENDIWTTGKTMPTARSNFGVTVKDGSIWVLGGVCGTAEVKAVEVFSPSLESWDIKKNLNKWNSDFPLSQIDGVFYSSGGKNSNKIEEYEPLTGLTTARSTLPVSLHGHSSVALNGKLIIIGGYNGTKYEDVLYSYTPDMGKWTRKNDMIYQRSFFTSTVANGKIYAFGGFGGKNYELSSLDTVEEYDPVNNQWTECPKMSSTKVNLASAEVNGKIYVCGGANVHPSPYDFYDNTEEYDPVNKKWALKNKMPEKRYMHEAVSLNNYMYVVGGRKAVYNEAIQDYDVSLADNILRYDPAKNRWTTLAAMNIPRVNHCVTVANGKIYAMGGQDERGKVLDSIEEYNPALNKWIIKKPMQTTEFQFGVFSLNDKIYVVGNRSEDFKEYDPKTETWTKKGNFVYNAYRHKVEYVNNNAYAIGGLNFHDMLIALDSVYASDDFISKLSIGSIVMEPREGKKSVPITISNIPTDGVYKAEVAVDFDPTKLSVLNVMAGETIPASSSFTYTVNRKIGKITVIFTGDIKSNKLIKTNGILANIEFDVLDTIQTIGSTAVSFDNSICKLYKSPTYQYQGIKFNNGSIDIFIYGDVDGTSTVTLDDYTIVKNYILDTIHSFQYDYGRLAADVDGNGLVNTLDAGFINKYSRGFIPKFPIQQ